MKSVKFFGMVMAGLLAGGCATADALLLPKSNPTLGATVTTATARQIADPLAGTREDPSVGLDGRAGANAVERYEESFKSK